jgi:hypothetical protein
MCLSGSRDDKHHDDAQERCKSRKDHMLLLESRVGFVKEVAARDRAEQSHLCVNGGLEQAGLVTFVPRDSSRSADFERLRYDVRNLPECE